MKAICMSKEFWANSQFSVVRYYGWVKIDGHIYMIVNKDGIDIFTLSIRAEKEGREKAIEPGEPCDLVRKDFIPLYHKVGRDRFLKVLKNNPDATDNELKKIFKTIRKEDEK